VSKRPDGPTEEGTDPLSSLSASQRIQCPFRVETAEPLQWIRVSRQQLTNLQESLLGIRAPKNQVKQILNLLVRDSFPLADLFPEKPDLLIHDIAEAQPTGHRLSGIFGGQNLGGKVQCPNPFQKRQPDDGGNPSSSTRADP
jgi:hypothetical protein